MPQATQEAIRNAEERKAIEEESAKSAALPEVLDAKTNLAVLPPNKRQAILYDSKAEVEEERKTYLAGVERLDGQIDEFNRCANTAGCFTSESEFSRRRQSLLSERTALESMRERLNGKITENNGRIEQYRMRQQTLGRLNDAMNSNIELRKLLKGFG